MTVKLPQKAGFVPTVQEWDQLVRIAENLAAQLAQAQASAVETARIVGAERDAARAEVARLTAAMNMLKTLCEVVYSRQDLLDFVAAALRGQPAPAPAPEAGNVPAMCLCGHTWGKHSNDNTCSGYACKCERFEPAPAGGEARE